MNAPINAEYRPGVDMTFRTAEQCAASLNTRFWQCWAERNGFAHSIERRHYYNLPSNTLMESMDNEPKRSEFYWELHVAVTREVLAPSGHNATRWTMPMMLEEVGGNLDTAIDRAIADTLEAEALRNADAAARESRFADLLARLPAIQTRHIMTGTRMIDDMRSHGGEVAELADLAVKMLRHEVVREALYASNKVAGNSRAIII